jgi:hypothetical protein
MTIEELNALYEATDFGNQVNYKAPTQTIPTDPNAGQPPILEPLIPILPPIINQGGDNDGGNNEFSPLSTYERTYDPNLNFAEFTSGVKGTPSFTQEYTERPGILEGLLSLPGNLIKGYMKYGPIGQVKKAIEFVKEKQRVAAENQRLADEINARDAARREKEYALQGRSDPTDQSRTGSLGRRPGSGGNVTATSANTNKETGTTYDSGGREGFGYGLKDGGRIRYGKGGIVTL